MNGAFYRGAHGCTRINCKNITNRAQNGDLGLSRPASGSDFRSESDGMGRGIEKPDLGSTPGKGGGDPGGERVNPRPGVKDLEEEELLVVDAWG